MGGQICLQCNTPVDVSMECAYNLGLLGSLFEVPGKFVVKNLFKSRVRSQRVPQW
jgi:hypothetical protein